MLDDDYERVPSPELDFDNLWKDDQVQKAESRIALASPASPRPPVTSTETPAEESPAPETRLQTPMLEPPSQTPSTPFLLNDLFPFSPAESDCLADAASGSKQAPALKEPSPVKVKVTKRGIGEYRRSPSNITGH